MAQQTPWQPSSSSPSWERLEAVVREHVQRLIHALLAEESTALLGRPQSARRGAVEAPQGLRNGDGKPRRLRLTSGTITGRRPRVRGLGERFGSRVWPWFQRRTRQVGEGLPQLSWPGLALGDFERALRGLLGAGAPLSATSLARLQASGPRDYDAWKPRRLDDREVVYVWADGLDVKAGLEDSTVARRVRIGALSDGPKVVLAVESGPRESTESWGAVRRDRRARGLQPWRGPIADGHLGLWAALAEQQPPAAAPRCWHHRRTNVVEASPHTQQAQARTRLCALPAAESQAACEPLRTPFATRSRQVAPNAVERLAHDWDRLVTFSQVPREHWRHLRTTNVVESPCAAARLRPSAAKRVKKVDSATAIIWKRLQVAERTCRRLNASALLPGVYAGAQYVDGLKQSVRTHQEVAA